MAYILLSISRFWLLLMGLCCAYQLAYTFLSLVKTPRWKPGAGTNRYAVLICARNEAAVLPKLLESLRAQDYPGVLDLYVAADNCTDDTARLARKGGATVFERHDLVHVGKGYALNFLLHRIWAEGKHYDGYLLFDADNLARPDFVRRLDGVFGPECPVVAGYRNTKNYRGWVAAGQGLCFIREVRFLNCPRTLLGFSGNVTGTGFLVSEEILRTAGGWPWHCLCEDLEFSTVQMIAGRRIAYCPQAEYFDEQPATLSQSVRQRLRWCKGFLQVMASRGAGLGRAALRGSWSCADLLISRIAPVLFNLLALGFAAVGAALAGGPVLVLAALGRILACGYLSMLVMAALTTCTEWKRIQAPAVWKLAGIFTFPLYMATYLPIALVACVRRVEWTPVAHTRAVSLNQLDAG
ncbi:glycosyltransferase family 2 protein [Allofournierella massiliensis]|uniref:Cellulose synthase/poly-beta-1,6-N-acetylglucosamine synthase-like glycosyltransferase n=1 Tax=Allofournierella massiliensis TaxID=1650663 RepID=A0A4R1R5H2_9FIRM|nr:glycosyltransferase family 2 protein [Fournierella massiliensis]TCL60766.1 cellulose synthase/poly-beta-1,6-N-acetylglucosamine synthase-like glycosyltransferase [Fournierella massiliensis]